VAGFRRRAFAAGRSAPGPQAFALWQTPFSCTAQGQGENDFKIDLARRAIVRALQQAAAGTPQDQADKVIQ
jgi:xanthine dehydrogenase YagS FAD-binding subunit